MLVAAYWNFPECRCCH